MSDFKVYTNLPRMMSLPSMPATPAAGSGSFSKLLNDAIRQVEDVDRGSQSELQELPSSEPDLHSVMVALEKADVSFQVMVQVRDKIIAAYQEIMKLQV
jgi:flagellar hook-basal body complex protein FliE